MDGKANPLGQSLLDRCHLRAGVEEPRYRQGPRGLEATGLQGLLVFGTYPDPDVDDGPVPAEGCLQAWHRLRAPRGQIDHRLGSDDLPNQEGHDPEALVAFPQRSERSRKTPPTSEPLMRTY